MQLNDHQLDALTELINIAFGRAAASLSDLTSDRVLIDVPRVTSVPIYEVGTVLSDLGSKEVATVQQVFSGPVSGDALLVLDHSAALSLVELLTQEELTQQKLFGSAAEVLTEVGNILLNACLGTFGNLLQVQFRFLVPRLHIESLEVLLNSLVMGAEEVRYALIVSTNFQLRNSAVSGHLLIVLGVSSFDRLMERIEIFG